MPHQMDSPEIQTCIKNCQECMTICLQTATHCLGLGGAHAGAEHQVLLQDCAHICGTAAGFMGRGSHHHHHICAACAEVCNACAENCERVGKGDSQMKQCADVCRRCAASCEKMAGAAV